MAAVPTPATTPPLTHQWSPDLMAFAKERRVAGYFDAMLEATRRVFPTARRIDVQVERDPEFADADGILFKIYVPIADIPDPDIVGVVNAWHTEAARCCPAPLICNFLLRLWREEA